jgi:DNA-binding transcriptional regulator YdaS (Cro superfamily)
MKNEIKLIDRITEHFGSAYKAAQAIGATHQQYYYWQSKGRIPFKRGNDIERATNGAIKAVEVWQEAGKIS